MLFRSRQPMEAAASPLPKLDTTPPVTKTYFADINATSLFSCSDWTYLVGTVKYGRQPHPNKRGKVDRALPAVEIPPHNPNSFSRLSTVAQFVPQSQFAPENDATSEPLKPPPHPPSPTIMPWAIWHKNKVVELGDTMINTIR